MSEQTIQDGLYSIPVQLDKYTCRSLGATTIKDLVKNKEITGLTAKECKDIKANKPDVLVLNKNKEIVIFIEMKTPDEFHSDALKRLAKYQELLVAKQTKAKIYVISDGDTFIWFNPLTEEHILYEDGSPVYRKINPKAYTTGGRGIESLFTEWIIKSLKKGGEANIILPDGIFTNIANDKLKKFILDTCYIESIISLPVGTFFNTPKKTYILTVHKRTDAEKSSAQPYPIFAYLWAGLW